MRSRRRCGTIALAFSMCSSGWKLQSMRWGAVVETGREALVLDCHRYYYWPGIVSHVGDWSRGVGKNSRRISQWCINGRRCSTRR